MQRYLNQQLLLPPAGFQRDFKESASANLSLKCRGECQHLNGHIFFNYFLIFTSLAELESLDYTILGFVKYKCSQEK